MSLALWFTFLNICHLYFLKILTSASVSASTLSVSHLLQILRTIRSLQQLAKIFRLQLPSAGAARCRATATRGRPGGGKEGEGCEAPSNQHQAKANLQMHGENQKWILKQKENKKKWCPWACLAVWEAVVTCLPRKWWWWWWWSRGQEVSIKAQPGKSS